ncbi:hypothetical protein [Nocardia colli]|uniref:hypothetical protein n=1 Tax=Nocardia colli TaxID=2545717 RepID=UPI0035E0E602
MTETAPTWDCERTLARGLAIEREGTQDEAFIDFIVTAAWGGESNSVAHQCGWCSGAVTHGRRAVRDRGPDGESAADIIVVGTEYLAITATIARQDHRTGHPRAAITFAHNAVTFVSTFQPLGVDHTLGTAQRTGESRVRAGDSFSGSAEMGTHQ